jgi:hypothetical protein
MCGGSSPRGSSSRAGICGPSPSPTSTASARHEGALRARRWRRCTARGWLTVSARSTAAMAGRLRYRRPSRSWSCGNCRRPTASSDRYRGCADGASSLEDWWPPCWPLCWPRRTSIWKEKRAEGATAKSLGNDDFVPSGRARRRGGLRRVRGQEPGHRRGGSDPLEIAGP